MSEPEIPHVIAGKPAVIARRYAAALYDMAEAKKQLDAAIADMRSLRNLIAENDEFYHLGHNPRLTRREVVEMLRQVAQVAKLGDVATSFLVLLGQNRRLADLQNIIAVFLYTVHQRHGEQTAQIFSARGLSAEQQTSLASNLGKMTGKKVSVVVREDPSLLGGLVAKVESIMIDASLKGKLGRIERHLKSHSSATVA